MKQKLRYFHTLILFLMVAGVIIVFWRRKEEPSVRSEPSDQTLSRRVSVRDRRNQMVILITDIASEMFPAGEFRGNEEESFEFCFKGISDFDVLNLITRIEHETGRDLVEEKLSPEGSNTKLSQSLSISVLAGRFLLASE